MTKPSPAVRLLRIDDAVREALDDSPEEFAAVFGATLGAESARAREVVAQTLAWLAKSPRAPEWGGFLVVDEASAAVIGTCGYSHGPEQDGTAEISYHTFPPYEGRGFATAMARALLERARQAAEVRAVVAHTLPEHNASTRILETIGFVRAGEAQDPDAGTVWRWEYVP